MQAGEWDETSFFRAITTSGARALMIGRRAMVVLGIPVMTADYDLWLHIDDIEVFNAAMAPLDLDPNYAPAEARARGRYVLEGDEHVDVMVARGQSAKDGSGELRFDDAWRRRQTVAYAGASIALPSVEDLIHTKAWAMRPLPPEAEVKRQELTPEIRALWEEPLEPEEFHRQLAAYLADEESLRENAELIDWFLRRYPTAEARLAYIRRKYAEWTREPESITG